MAPGRLAFGVHLKRHAGEPLASARLRTGAALIFADPLLRERHDSMPNVLALVEQT